MAQKMIPQIPKSPYRRFCDEMWAAWWTEITRDSSWLTESLTIIRFFKIISNICYYLNINVLSLFQWAITKVNSNISSNVKSSTEDRCTYICMYRECHALAHWLLSIKARNGGFVACSFQTLQITLNLKQVQRLFFSSMKAEELKISYFWVVHIQWNNWKKSYGLKTSFYLGTVILQTEVCLLNSVGISDS